MTNDTEHCEHRTQIQVTNGQAWADCAHCWDAGLNVHPDDRLGNVIDATEPTPENRGLLPVGYVVDGSPIEQRSVTAYLLADGRWVSFDRVHGRPAAVEPLVMLGGVV